MQMCGEHLFNSMKGPLICNLLQSETLDLWGTMSQILEIDPLLDATQSGCTVLFSTSGHFALLCWWQTQYEVSSDPSNLRWSAFFLPTYWLQLWFRSWKHIIIFPDIMNNFESKTVPCWQSLQHNFKLTFAYTKYYLIFSSACKFVVPPLSSTKLSFNITIHFFRT